MPFKIKVKKSKDDKLSELWEDILLLKLHVEHLYSMRTVDTADIKRSKQKRIIEKYNEIIENYTNNTLNFISQKLEKMEKDITEIRRNDEEI